MTMSDAEVETFKRYNERATAFVFHVVTGQCPSVPKYED